MEWLDLWALPTLARIGLVILFPFSTLDKIFNYKAAVAQARSSFLPGGALLLVLGGLCEVITPICIVSGYYDRLAAFVLAGYCIVTAVLFHQFWAQGDFWAKGDSKGRVHFWDFWKNVGLAGGLLLIIVGGAWVPASAVLRAPLSSAPYAATPGLTATNPEGVHP